MNTFNYKDSQKAFETAIKLKELNTDPKSERYAGNWMYMHSSLDGTIDYFKNILYRNYIEVSLIA